MREYSPSISITNMNPECRSGPRMRVNSTIYLRFFFIQLFRASCIFKMNIKKYVNPSHVLPCHRHMNINRDEKSQFPSGATRRRWKIKWNNGNFKIINKILRNWKKSLLACDFTRSSTCRWTTIVHSIVFLLKSHLRRLTILKLCCYFSSTTSYENDFRDSPLDWEPFLHPPLLLSCHAEHNATQSVCHLLFAKENGKNKENVYIRNCIVCRIRQYLPSSPPPPSPSLPTSSSAMLRCSQIPFPKPKMRWLIRAFPLFLFLGHTLYSARHPPWPA